MLMLFLKAGGIELLKNGINDMKPLTQQEEHADDGIVYCALKKPSPFDKQGRALYPNDAPILRRLCLIWQQRGYCEGIVCEQKPQE